MPDAVPASSAEREHRTATGGAISSPTRGPLRLDIDTSSPVLEAGRFFSVLLTISNPFDVPVSITRATTVVPIEFIDVEQRRLRRERRDLLYEADQISKNLYEKHVPHFNKAKKERQRAIRKAVLSFFTTLIPFAPMLQGAYDATRVIVASNASIQKRPRITDGDGVDLDEIHKDIEDMKDISSPEIERKLDERMLNELKQQLSDLDAISSEEILLEPGNSIVQAFTLCTRTSILFPPSTYELPIQIEYKIGDKTHRNAFKHKINIRSPLRAVILGSVIGASVGFILKDIFGEKNIIAVINSPHTLDFFIWLVALLGNVLLAVVVVVAFARKRETQPILSVEDFWGGLFVGAMTGYTGKSMINGLFPTPK